MKTLTFSYLAVISALSVSVACPEGKTSRISKRENPIVFPGATESDKSKKELPLNVIRQMNEITRISDLLENFVEPENLTSSEGDLDLFYSVSSRSGEDPVERNSVNAAVPAACIPELTTVSLALEKHTADFYYPQCIRVKRCGGCCGSSLLSCQPESTQILNFAIVTAAYSGNGKLIKPRKEIIEVEEHTSCKCDCKTSEKDCSRYQRFNSNTCTCECINDDEKLKCFKERGTKVWNPNSCLCMCRREEECGSGKYFNPYTCSCRRAPEHTRWTVDDYTSH